MYPWNIHSTSDTKVTVDNKTQTGDEITIQSFCEQKTAAVCGHLTTAV